MNNRITANTIKIKIGFAANEINVGKKRYEIKPNITIKIIIVIMTPVVSLFMIFSLTI